MAMLRLIWLLLHGTPVRTGLLILCLAVAVAARVGLGTVVAGVEAGLVSDARRTLGGDVEIAAARLIPPAEQERLVALEPPGTQAVEIRSCLSMASVPGTSIPVDLRSVGSGYPLIGRVVSEPPEAFPVALGACLVEEDLLQRLHLTVGATVLLGGQAVRIAGVLRQDADGSASAIAIGPRVLVSLDTLRQLGLDGRGSRLRIARLLVLPPTCEATVEARRLRVALGIEEAPEGAAESGGPAGAGLRIRSAAEAQRQTWQSLSQVADFLRLTSLLALLLGAVGVVTLVRGQVIERADDLALLRLLGASRRRAGVVIIGQGVVVGLLGGVVGVLLGVAVAAVLGRMVADIMPGGVPAAWHLPSVLLGLALGAILGGLAAWPPLRALGRLSPGAILRGESAPLGAVVGPTAIVLLVLVGLAALDAGRMGSVVVVVLAVLGVGLSWWFRWLLPWCARVPLSRRGPRRALLAAAVANLGRPGLGGPAAAAALAGAGVVIGALVILRSSLMTELAPERGDTRPSLFLLDVQTDDVEALRGLLAEEGVGSSSILAPMVRARLRHAPAPGVPGQADLARYFRDREQNLSFRTTASPDEQVVAGVFGAPGTLGLPAASLELVWAQRLGYHLGDRIRFDIQGVPLEAEVTSLRRVRWTSLRPNFLILIAPKALQDAPQTWIATIGGLDVPHRRALQARLVDRFPDITILDVSRLAAQVQTLVGRVGVMVQVLAGLAVLAGLVLLAGLAVVSARSRREDAVLYRVLGADRWGIVLLIGAEYVLLGLVAATAGIGAITVVAILALPALWTVPVVVPGMVLAVMIPGIALLGAVVGVLACTDVIRSRPAEVLRAA